MAKKNTNEVLGRALKRFEIAKGAWSEIYNTAKKELDFVAGEHWDPKLKQSRLTSNPPKPVITINKLPQIINHIVNDQRQHEMSLAIHPINSGADEEVAKIIRGIIRNIERNSDAEVARRIAFESAVRCGIGFYRVGTQYVDDTSLDQEIFTEQIKDPFSVFIDPSSVKQDGSDMDWAFVIKTMSKDEFNDAYPDASDVDNWEGTKGWISEDEVRIAEYFEKRKENHRTVYFDPETGEAIEESEIPEGYDKSELKSRKVSDTVIHWYKLNYNEVLEETIWAGKFIPVIPVYGQELYIDGKRQLYSAIYWAKEPSKLYNYWQSTITESLMMAPKTPYVGAVGQFAGLEKRWANVNASSAPYIEYNPITVNGQIAPPPQRQSGPQVPAAAINAAATASDEIKATTGIYDASLGARGNETSGRAILARQQEGDVANFHFADNLQKSMKQEGRIYVDIIPKIYDTESVVNIVDDEDKDVLVKLNEMSPTGEVLNDLSAGTYGVVVDTGANFQTKRQEASESMLAFMKMYPASAPVIGDLIAKNMDWPGSEQIAERLKLLMPPQVLKGEEGEEAQVQAEEQLKAVVQDLQKMMEQNKELEKKNAELQKVADKNVTDLKTTLITANKDIIVAHMKAQGDIKDTFVEERMNNMQGLAGNQENPETPNPNQPV